MTTPSQSPGRGLHRFAGCCVALVFRTDILHARGKTSYVRGMVLTHAIPEIPAPSLSDPRADPGVTLKDSLPRR